MKRLVTFLILLSVVAGFAILCASVMDQLTHHAPAEPTPVEKSVAELTAQVAELKQQSETKIAAVKAEAAASIAEAKSHFEAMLPKPNERSILTEDEQREKFAADYPVIAKQIEKPVSCPLPEVGKAELDALRADFQKQLDELKPKPAPKKAAPKPGVPGRMSAIANGNRYAVAVVRQTNCGGCNDLESRAIHTPLWDAELRNAHCGWAIVNVDQEPAFKSYFRVPATPWGIAYDTNTDHWHSIAFNQNNQFDGDVVAVQKVQAAIAAIPN